MQQHRRFPLLQFWESVAVIKPEAALPKPQFHPANHIAHRTRAGSAEPPSERTQVPPRPPRRSRLYFEQLRRHAMFRQNVATRGVLYPEALALCRHFGQKLNPVGFAVGH